MVLLVCFLGFFSGDCSADNVGREFYVLFLESSLENSDDPYLHISLVSSSPFLTASVRVSAPRGSYSFSATLTRGQVTTIRPPSNTVLRGSGYSNQALLIQASEDVVVFAANKQGSTCGAFSVLPVDVFSQHYMVSTYWPGSRPNQVAEIGIVSMEDDNDITLKFVEDKGYAVYGGDTYNSDLDLRIRLDKSQAFQLKGATFSDLSGTYIEGTKNLAVFAGNNVTNIIGISDDHIVEQMLPNYSHGKEYIIIPVPARETGDRVKIIATRSNTLVYNAGGALTEPTPPNPFVLP